MTRIERRHPFTGEIITAELDIEPLAFHMAEMARTMGMLIQDAYPSLNASEREFIKTGILPEDLELGSLNEDIKIISRVKPEEVEA
jgi:ABC-type cobalamin/Fe3+-siderophores transport system ATPase subunit